MPPSLAVIVPIFDVEDYLRPCLDSVLAQTRPPSQVILVDDGSTDSSGRIADEYAAAHPGWQVLHVENGGLGRARNLGFERVGTDYVAFLDSDDVVPPSGYDLLLSHLEESDSDIASGAVMRYDGTSLLPSPLHVRAIQSTELGTHITRSPQLIFDTTAWNKVFRTAFWRQHGLAFPEGVFYEDIPVTIPAHYLARSVDVVAEPVYWWRERQTASVSITQRRGEVRNLVDRMTAIETVERFLVERGLVEDKLRHDRKVITVDLRLYLMELLEADDEFRREFVHRVGEFVRQTDERVLRELGPVDRLLWWLVAHSSTERVLEVLEQQAGRSLNRRVLRGPLRLTADLPFRGDRSVGVPGWVYDVTNSQPMRAQLDDAVWQGDVLSLRGHAFIEQVPLTSTRTSRLRIEARDAVTARSRRLPVRRVRDQEQTAATSTTPTSYEWCGFETRLDAAALASTGTGLSTHRLLAHLTTLSARRGRGVRQSSAGRASTPGRRLLADGTLAVAGWGPDGFQLALHRDPTYLRAVRRDGTVLQVGLRLGREHAAAAAAGRLSVALVRTGADEVVRQVSPDGTFRLDVATLPARGAGVPYVDWSLMLAGPGRPAPVPAGPDLDEPACRVRQGELGVEIAPTGEVLLRDASPGPRVDRAGVEHGHLVLGGRTESADPPAILLVGTADRVEYPAAPDGPGRWLARIPLDGPAGTAALRRLRAGRYWLRCPEPAIADSERPLRITGPLAGEPLLRTTTHGVQVDLAWTTNRNLLLEVDPWGPLEDRGAFNLERNAGPVYASARREPRQPVVLFEAWKGRQYSDSPRAIFEELRSRNTGHRLVWAVSHHGVEVPDDVEVVLRLSADYYRALGTATAIVSNDSLDRGFRKRSDSVYLQTWHGTPLKKIGHDIGTVRFANRNYLAEFSRDVAGWDLLVSPNPFSSEVLPRAFRYPGTVLDSGYPRNDVFHRPEQREQRARQARERLGLPADRTVVLYAPTWRDTKYDAAGRYTFDMRLDLEHLHGDLGVDAVLLVRGHQLVAHSISRLPFPGFVRDVSLYPDITDLYLLADVLVTDYSSTMFDFANTGRPMVFFAYDLEQYRDELRGFYLDYLAEAPGPVVVEPAQAADRLCRAVVDPAGHAAEFADRYEAFRRAYCGWEDGKAAVRVADALLARIEALR